MLYERHLAPLPASPRRSQNGCCKSYVKAAGRSRARVRLTLCDPFTNPPAVNGMDGLMSMDRSTQAAARAAAGFGREADFAEHYLNTDDIVPSTSTPLPLCYCYDVTESAERKKFPMPGGGKSADIKRNLLLRALGYHNWPMGYYLRHYETVLDGEGRIVHPSHSALPRGGVVHVA